MLHNINQLGQILTAREMKQITGGDAPQRKYICVVCGPMDVHCASVAVTDKCEVLDHDSEVGNQGFMGCKNDNMEDYSFRYFCP